MRKLFRQSVATVQNVPLVLILLLLIRFLFLFRLGLYCQFLELLAIHFNVGPHNLISYSRYSLIPVLLLGAISQTLYHNGIGSCHVSFYHLLDCFRIEKQQSSLCGLVMHTLTRLEQPFEQCWTKFCKFSINLVSHEIENFFDFLNEDDFFGWACDGPETKKT